MLQRLRRGGDIQSGGRRRHPLFPHVGESAAAAQYSATKPGLHHQQGWRDRGSGQSAPGEDPPGGQAAEAPSSQSVRLGEIQLHLQVGLGFSSALFPEFRKVFMLQITHLLPDC